MSGEEPPAAGADGVRRAKTWLELTTRANVQWVNPEPLAVPKLTFPWVDGRKFSFDFGGVFLGEDIHNQEFLAESKYYANAADQGSHYRKFLAQCYRAYEVRPERCDHFVWVTWAPFLVNRWSELRTPDYVEESVAEYRDRHKLEAEAPCLTDNCKEVASRIWLLLLTDKQEKLTPTRDHLAQLRAYDTMRGV